MIFILLTPQSGVILYRSYAKSISIQSLFTSVTPVRKKIPHARSFVEKSRAALTLPHPEINPESHITAIESNRAGKGRVKKNI